MIAAIPCLLLLLGTVLAEKPEKNVCVPTEPSTFHFSSTSYRNTTGHWIAEVTVTHDSSTANADSLPKREQWGYGIDFNRVKCAEKEYLQTIYTVTAPPSWNRDDYSLHPALGYYKFHREKLTWQEAKDACAGEGAHLAVGNSAEEEEALKKEMEGRIENNHGVWIGISDTEIEGDWMTVLGTPLSSVGYARWEPGKPGDNRNLNCGGMYSATGLLFDYPCDKVGSFLCEHSF